MPIALTELRKALRTSRDRAGAANALGVALVGAIGKTVLVQVVFDRFIVGWGKKID